MATLDLPNNSQITALEGEGKQMVTFITTAFTMQQLKDINSALINDTQGTHGDERSLRLDTLQKKVSAYIKKEGEGK